MYREEIIENLRKMIDINIPIIYINDYDTVRINKIIEEAASGITIKEWNPGICQIKDFGCLNLSVNTEEIKSKGRLDNLVDRLSRKAQATKENKLPSILVLREIQDYITEAPVKSLLALIAQRKLYDPNFELTVLIVSSVIKVPEELLPYVSFLDINFPDDEEIRNILYRHLFVNERSDEAQTELRNKKESEINEIVSKYIRKHNKNAVDQVEALLPNFRGMMPFDIDRMVDMAMSRNGTLGADDYKMILDHKKQLVKKSGVLELIETNVSIDDIGGLNNLKEYLKRKAIIRKYSNEALNKGISLPKGIFLVGMPGCGKSLSAQATASLFKEPLLRLDMGSLMGSKVGESEKNLRKAIKIAEAAAPCVLWVDEIEKGFAGSNNDDNAYLRRMFGFFLSWLQDKKTAVFVIATANNLETLPLEFKRKGRFDDMFFVDLPNKEECKAILDLKIKKILDKWKSNDSLGKFEVPNDGPLVKYVAGKGEEKEDKHHHFCGADIEYVVNKSFEMMFRKQKIDEQRTNLENEIKNKQKEDSDLNQKQEELKKLNEQYYTNGPYMEDGINIPDRINEQFLLEVAKKTRDIGMSANDESFKKMAENAPTKENPQSPYLPAS